MNSGNDLLHELLLGRFAHQQTGYRIYPPGMSSPSSIATFHRLHLVLSGRLNYTVEGKTYTLMPGDQSLATAWIRRRWEVPGPEPLEFVFFAFDTANPISAAPGLFIRHMEAAALKVERDMFARLHSRHIDYIEPKDELLAEGEIKGSLARFFTDARRCGGDVDTATRALHPQVRRAQQYLMTHFDDTEALQRAYDEIRITPGYLRKLFHAGTGQTPGAFLLRVRMQRARYLLQATSMSVKEVAARVGFNDPLHLSRRYAAFWKVAPSLDRKPSDTVTL
jgi:AraC-like DNA-binding protein